MAHFRPELRQYYYAHAKTRHTAATSLATPLLCDISPENVIPMHCFSIMTLFISFASLKDEDDLPFDTNGIVPRWLALFRGVRTVLESNNRAIYKSKISFLFHSVDFNNVWQSNQSDLESLAEFKGYLETSPEEDSTRELLCSAFQDMQKAFYFFYHQDLGNDGKVRSLFTWMYKVPDEFLSLLRQGNSKALCIMAFLCVLLHRLEYNWYFQGWATQLIERIYAALDDVHRFWIRWPIQEIGWVPKREASLVMLSAIATER
ncbi:hypothetical protein NLG97_g1360 [Lecanicillium saksenae]|uniref:Uncharacterized protein n=1 Tax=Lecanicillium saksenae TaxID=468837 RepID=A0ACC1R5D9_9HYPO|nr:hypothetical protein NLG97_g1360 [Lecanicillium saksenae]